MNGSERILKLLLRLFGAATGLAIFAVFMPLSWMAACHERLGLGAMPAGPVVEYLARSVSAFYAILGGLLLLASSDVRRHAAVIAYVAVVCLLGGAGVFVLDLLLALPWWWTWGEGPLTVLMGIIILLLQRRVKGRPPQPI